jgi:hypothetical protein
LRLDLQEECRRRGLPAATISPGSARPIPAQRLIGGSARLEFRVAVSGPLLLGRTRFLGGGVFAGTR